tara:strand:+ start:105 stop:545 length:441 start_codon:yes stop_codon:yes gene_type:complete
MKRFFLILFLLFFNNICIGNFVVKDSNKNDNNDYNEGLQAISQKKWNVALNAFKKAEPFMRESADLHNFLGFTYRNLGDLDKSFFHYKKSLYIDPNHVGAHEYIGEAYLIINNLKKAKFHLSKLKSICGENCEEYKELLEAINSFK